MTNYSIEFLGQKFSYPTTWQGAFSVLVVCASLSFLVYKLSPEQIDSIGTLLGRTSDQQFENNLVEVNQKLKAHNKELQAQVTKLSQMADISAQEKKKITSTLAVNDKQVKEAYRMLIQEQTARKAAIAALQSSNPKHQQFLNLEQAKLSERISKLKLQQSE